MPSCQEIALALTESLDEKVSLRHRLRVTLHVAICKECHALKKQLLMLRKAIRRVSDAETLPLNPNSSLTMTTEFRAKLHQTVNHYQQKLE